MARALEVLRERGNDVVAVEAGPHVFGSMLGDGLVDELFLTLSPVLAGRSEGQSPARAWSPGWSSCPTSGSAGRSSAPAAAARTSFSTTRSAPLHGRQRR